MINIENLTKLINHLTKVNERNFDMTDWLDYGFEWKWRDKPVSELVAHMHNGYGDCGTSACIAGHASMLMAAEVGKVGENILHNKVQYDARAWLGLSEGLKNALFKPGVYDNDGNYIGNRIINHSLPRAIAVLEHLKETAEMGDPQVNWEVLV